MALTKEQLIAEAEDIEKALNIAIEAHKQGPVSIEVRIAQLERWVASLMRERAKDLRQIAATIDEPKQ